LTAVRPTAPQGTLLASLCLVLVISSGHKRDQTRGTTACREGV
jgi:hypothetical protein